MPIISELKWASMTAAINKMRSPNNFVSRLLYGNHSPQTTETIEIDLWIRGRKMAPFIISGASAVPVDGPTQERRVVTAPNIRIKRELKPSELLFGRTPGSVIFPTKGAQTAAIRSHIARELQPLADDITNTIEWMACQTLRGTLSYSNTKYDGFTIDYQRPAENDVTLASGAHWDESGADIPGTIMEVKRIMAVEGFRPTDAIMNSNVADSFMGNTVVQNLLDKRNIQLGNIDFTTQFEDDGTIYLGSVSGVRFWEYNRTVNNDGSDEDLIRDGYVEFVSRTPASDFVLYFGAIPDMEAFEGGTWVGERFAKSQVNFDPPTVTALAHSRPLPVPRRPGATVSVAAH